MIIVQLYGGLGNQMFQYAFAFTISNENKTKFKFDTFFLSSRCRDPLFTNRDYSLSVFNINSSEKINLFEYYGFKILKFLSDRKLFNLDGKYKVISEKKFTYDRELMLNKDNCYFIGYYQSEKYFKKYSNEIRRIFQFSVKMDLINQQISEKILAQNSVSIHIRRGDYLNNINNSVHGLCSIDYYTKAIEFIKSIIQNPVFYIFSDDITWATLNIIPSPNSIYICHNTGKNSYRDMQLMSMCKHNIIANSSFSWWAAWLNSNKDKIVIAPHKWFFDGCKNSQTSDLIPDNWIRL